MMSGKVETTNIWRMNLFADAENVRVSPAAQ
jgi:hypothetical protein